MAIDREETLRKAEKFLRQGRLDAAIAEYVRVVEDQPRDWATANTLGDLYVRAGQLDRAAAQYGRMADHFMREGFLPKAAALYRKIVKIRPDDEPAQLQFAEVSARQGLLADAKSYFQAVAERRRARGDTRGAEEVLVRLGTLDPGDFEARRNSARVLAARGDRPEALARLRELATDLSQRGRDAEALEILREIAAIDPSDLETRGRLAQLAIDAADLETARQYLTFEVAQNDPVLLRMAAEMELRAGRLNEARQFLTQALAIDPASRAHVQRLARSFLVDQPAAAFVCVDALADAASAVADWTTAAEILHTYVSEVPHHIPALMKLIEVCVDGGFETTMLAAQAQLAHAHLAAGRAAQARVIAEDLIAHEPGDPAHVQLLRSALRELGEPEAEAAAPEIPPPEAAPDSGPLIETLLAELERLSAEEQAEEAMSRAPGAGRATAKADGDVAPAAADQELELDLTGALDDLRPSVLPAVSDAQAEQGSAKPQTLEEVFDDFREQAAREAIVESAAEQFKLGLAYRDAGMVMEAIRSLEAAARSPRHRFEAATLLGRLYKERGAAQQAIEWFERAAEAPAPTPEDSRALLYELADTLVGAGEPARALAVFLELQADTDDYRDVRARVEQLSRVQAGG